jgi:hypothetical protein
MRNLLSDRLPFRLIGVYKRIGKGGKEVWILASYNPT